MAPDDPITMGVAPCAGLAHVKGDSTAPLSDSTVYGLLTATAARFPDRPAVVFREEQLC